MKDKLTDLLFLILCYLSAGILAHFNFLVTPEFSNQNMQTFLLISLCFILGVILILTNNALFRAVFLMISYILIVVNGSLQGDSIAVELFSMIALEYLLVREYKTVINSSVSLVILPGFILSQRDMLIMGERISGPSVSDVTLMTMLLILCLFLFNRIRAGRIGRLRLVSDLLARENTIEHLTDANRDFQKFAIDVEEVSRIDERKRITREIHDITGYTLTGISMMLEHADDLLSIDEKEKLRSVLSTAREQARKGHEEIRRSLIMLRAIEEDENFYSRVLQILKNFEKATAVRVSVDFTNMAITINKLGQSMIYRFLQEGLTNAFRHGKATSVFIMFFQEQENIVISLEDNGIGGYKIQEGIGLQGMNERISKLQGSISYSSTSIGFNLIARIPVISLKRSDS